MARASTMFSEADRKTVEEAIATAESKTSAEIVVAATTRSGRYDRAEDLFGLAAAMIMTGVIWLAATAGRASSDAQWETGWSLGWRVCGLAAVFLVTFIICTALASRFFPLARLFQGRRMMEKEVRQSATAVFHRFRINRTAQGTGMLIYVSLAERLVWVTGDDAINEKLDQSVWDQACKTIVGGIKNGRAAAGLRDAVLQCGNVLAEHFPISADDENELSNEMIIID